MPAKYVTPPDHDAALREVLAGATDPADREARVKANNDEAQGVLERLGKQITQGEWLALTRKLDLARPEIEGDNNLALLAMAYFADKRTHGRSSLEVLLDFTDTDLLAFHGFVVDEGGDLAAGDQAGDQADDHRGHDQAEDHGGHQG